MSQPLWTPSPERVARARLTRFLEAARARTGLPLPDYDALHAWSLDDRAAFWGLVWDELGVVASTPPEAVLTHGDAMPGARWFEGARLSFAENLLRHEGDAPALVGVDETGGPDTVVSRDGLRVLVARFQAFLRAQGVGPGDRVAAWMPNRVEAVVAMLAASSLGAVYSSSSPDFGVRGVLDRFGQIRPKVLLVADGSRYGGRSFPLADKIAEVAAALAPDLRAVVWVDVVGTPPPAHLPGVVAWADAVAHGPDVPTFAQLPFDHPLYVLYSSGTTGVPKCIVHGQGGTLVQHLKELALHTDVGPGDVLFYFTTCGWMMWNWLVSGLAVGATVVLYDGSPASPSSDVLWAMAERLRITHFGTSPKFLAMCAKDGLSPGHDHDLGALRTVMSTGSPLPVEGFRYVTDHVGADVQVASICGGTDIVSCFMLGCPTEPVHAGEIQRRGLGMAVEAWVAPHEPVVGRKGELVCTLAFPSMPLGFWDDADGSRYHRAYFAHFPGVWRHGDYIEITERGGVIVYGRSDATLNPGGVRIGTAEIYRPVEALDEIQEALVVGLPTPDDDVEVVLFVVPAPGVALDDALQTLLRRRIRELASPRHVPARILACPAVPRTISGKKVELATLEVLQGREAANADALANPEALAWFATEGRAALTAS
ncbi:MAG: acetoacetate--CoA ligase [Alphaproteobacteria bacterium]|nr:acetoacetate--CoA ligase [Alphaproteobacteria bacterium]